MSMTTILGYARVSTTGQDLDARLTALTAAGVDAGRVFTDELSGSAKTARPGLAAMLDYARANDTVVVTAIDRLGRARVALLGNHRCSGRAHPACCRAVRRTLRSITGPQHALKTWTNTSYAKPRKGLLIDSSGFPGR
jgi:DNA invertase Pin-like site-specific DNA recombinase